MGRLRTHMMVSRGAAIFTIAVFTTVPDESNVETRVIEGTGFLSAGTILKLSSASLSY